jgi:hypothetical protein
VIHPRRTVAVNKENEQIVSAQRRKTAVLKSLSRHYEKLELSTPRELLGALHGTCASKQRESRKNPPTPNAQPCGGIRWEF